MILPLIGANHRHDVFTWTISRWGDHQKLSQWTGLGQPTLSCKLKSYRHQTGLFPQDHLEFWHPVYTCPLGTRGRAWCADPSHAYCPKWGCESNIEENWWKVPSPDPDIKIIPRSCTWCLQGEQKAKAKCPGCNKYKRTPDPCDNFTVTITNPDDPTWFQGKTWGLRLYSPGIDPMTFFHIIKTAPSKTHASKAPSKPHTPPPNITLSPHTRPITTITLPPPSLPRFTPSSSDLIKMVQSMALWLNASQPNLTAPSCWLCLQASPPFYDPYAISNVSIISSTQPTTGHSQSNLSLFVPFSSVQGKGICVNGSSTNQKKWTLSHFLSNQYIQHLPIHRELSLAMPSRRTNPHPLY